MTKIRITVSVSGISWIEVHKCHDFIVRRLKVRLKTVDNS